MSTKNKESEAPKEEPPKEEEPSKKEEVKKRDPIKFWTRTTLIVLVAVFVAHILSDKYVPYTSDARVEAYVVPLSAEVAGRLSEVYVTNNQIVKQGDKLVEIDKQKFEIAVKQAENDLQTATQASDADLASVTTAQAQVNVAEANLKNSKIMT